jgi:hypothetical protein
MTKILALPSIVALVLSCGLGVAARDFPRLQRIRNLFPFHKPGRYLFDRDLPCVNGLGESDCPTHGQRLRQFADEHLQPCAMQAQGNAGSQIAPATDEDKSGHIYSVAGGLSLRSSSRWRSSTST